MTNTTLLLIISAISLICITGLFLVIIKKIKSSNNNSQSIDVQNFSKDIANLKEQFIQVTSLLNSNVNSNLQKSEATTHNLINSIQVTQKNDFVNIEKKVDDLIYKNEVRIARLTDEVNKSLSLMRVENEKKLEQMRETVDEKLNNSLSQRLNESFSKIQSSLEHVDLGLGEMKALANGVGDLKKMLGNVKTRGVWGEVMLNSLLEQILSPSQYMSQVQIKENSRERVDFVVIMPGKDDKEIYLPIDSKFPLDDYYRLAEASDMALIEEMDKCHKAIAKRIKEEAKKISEKYIMVPATTDFAVMFLPIEGLYAEVVRDVELINYVQNECKVIVSGPTTLVALLNSLQMGFKTLSIEKRSSEIWSVLSEFKNEFEKFVSLLLKTQNKISDANDTIEQATKSSKKIAKKLSDVSTVVGVDYDSTNKLDAPNDNDDNK